MTDPLEDLLKSPITDRRGGRARPPARPGEPSGPPWRVFAAAAAIGGLLVLGGFLLASDDKATPTTVASLTTAAIEVPDPLGALPSGYLAVDDRVGARAERVLIRPDGVFVTFSLAVRSSLDPAGTAGFGGGRWELALADGSRVAASGEFHDPYTPGVFTVAFPVGGVAPGDPTSVEMIGRALRAGRNHSFSVETPAGLPWSGVPGENVVPLEGDLAFRVTGVELAPDGGRVDWELTGGSAEQALLSAEIRLFAEGAFGVGVMTEAAASSVLQQFGAASPPPQPARQGSLPLGNPGLGQPEAVRRADFELTIDWVTFVAATASLQLDGVPVATAGP